MTEEPLFSRLVKCPVPEWQSLKALGQNRVLRSSYFWFVFVPIAARLVGQLEQPFVMEFSGQRHQIALTLPFSWYHFFFAAVLFSLGNIIFVLRCPPLVQRYNTPQQSADDDNGPFFLHRQLIAIPEYVFDQTLRHSLLYAFRATEFANREFSAAQEWIDQFGEDATPSAFEVSDLISANLCELKTATLGSLFELVHGAHSQSRPLSRIFATAVYLLGFFFVGMVLFDNVRFVLSDYFAR